MPMKELTKGNKLAANTAALGATLQMLGIESEPLEAVVTRQFKKKGDAVVAENIAIARAGYDYAAQNFKAVSVEGAARAKPLGVITGNQAIAMGGAAAGVKFYAAYPMSPSTGVLMWMAAHARQLGIMVRQVEDEIGVMNMVIGAAHAGCRAMCATSGGGFALMTEAIGMAGMIETPVVCVDVQRAGPATGVPTKTEQGDLWQVLGAGQGDYPRIIVAPSSQLDLFQDDSGAVQPLRQIPVPRPGAGRPADFRRHIAASIPADLDFNVKIDRGELILPNGNGERHNRFAAATTTMPTCATRTPRAAFRRAPCRACPATSSRRRHRRTRRRWHAHQRRVHQPAQAPHDGREAGAQDARPRSTTSRRRNWSVRRTPPSRWWAGVRRKA